MSTEGHERPARPEFTDESVTPIDPSEERPMSAISTLLGMLLERRISWAQLIRKVFEVDPMLCPFCGGRLKVLSFTLELGAIRRFLASIDCESQKPEPLGHSPPQEELLFEPC